MANPKQDSTAPTILCDCERCRERGEPVAYGTCHCGCGELTNPAPWTDEERGYVKGKPVYFRTGHAGRKPGWKERLEMPPPNPSGVCQYSGCEERTLLATYTARHAGILEGHPLRFCPAHYRHGRKRVELSYDIVDRGYTDPETGEPSPCHVFNRKPRLGPDREYGTLGDRLAHIAAWEKANGPLPRGLVIHHKCFVKLCVNPEHLEALTRSEHMKIHSQLRIDQETIDGILDALRAATLPKGKIAAQFGVSRSYVFNLQKRHGL